jgi:predicted TIM-barrel fold metal-dependent hydrolase
MLYINVDGLYGKGSHEKPEYSTLQSFLHEMDRLGVWGSVVTNVIARDCHPLVGNRKLMEDLAAIPDAAKRVIPAFYVTPRDIIEPETMGYLHEMMGSGCVGVISIAPVTGRYPLRALERLFRDLRKYALVVLLSKFEFNTYDELIALAAAFPEMKFIIQAPMWGDCTSLFDVMWRCPNIYTDTSHLHIRFIHSTIAQHLGNGRAVFGIAYRAIAGAPMAGLIYSNLSEKAKNDIASGTFLSLLPNREFAEDFAIHAQEVNSQVKNSYWHKFCKGRGLHDIDIIDAHGHLGVASTGWYLPYESLDEQLSSLAGSMDRLGISSMISSASEALKGEPVENNANMAQGTASRRKHFLGYYVFHPLYNESITDEVLDEAFAGDYFVGFKTLADYWHVPVTDASYNHCWEYADKHHLPILFHSWEGICDTPDMIASIAERYPNATFMLGHSGGGDIGRAQAVRACQQLDNVILEFCGSFCARTTWEDTMSRIDPHKAVFGTDTYAHDQAWELGRLLSCDISDDLLDLLLNKNIKRILSKRI